jgi:hypothetical protein
MSGMGYDDDNEEGIEAKIRAMATPRSAISPPHAPSITRQRPSLHSSLDRLKFSCKVQFGESVHVPDLLLFLFFNEIMPIQILISFYRIIIISSIISIVVMHYARVRVR